MLTRRLLFLCGTPSVEASILCRLAVHSSLCAVRLLPIGPSTPVLCLHHALEVCEPTGSAVTVDGPLSRNNLHPESSRNFYLTLGVQYLHCVAIDAQCDEQATEWLSRCPLPPDEV